MASKVKRNEWCDGFDAGYICAVANIIRTHDEPTVAKDVLAGNIPASWTLVDKDDLNILVKHGVVKL